MSTFFAVVFICGAIIIGASWVIEVYKEIFKD